MICAHFSSRPLIFPFFIVPTWQRVDDLESEEDELAFIHAFRALLRIKNVLASYSDFSWDDLGIDEQRS